MFEWGSQWYICLRWVVQKQSVGAISVYLLAAVSQLRLILFVVMSCHLDSLYHSQRYLEWGSKGPSSHVLLHVVLLHVVTMTVTMTGTMSP
jgi:hypothetical protein